MNTTTLTPEAIFSTLIAEFEKLVGIGQPLLIAIAVLFALGFVLKVARKFKRIHKDGARLYSERDRNIGFARAGGRCEMEGFLWFRCSRAAKHGDHHYPHSRGGATTMQNFVAACAKCNMSKGAKVPTRMASKRMENRRRKYFPKGVPVTVGERITNKSRKLAAANANSWN